MSTYELIVEFDPADLGAVQPFKVVLQRATVDQDPGNVIWASFPPAQKTVVEWGGTYGFYTSVSKLEEGNEIVENATKQPVYPEKKYTFGSDGTFSGPEPDALLEQDEYAVLNQHDDPAGRLFGMSQQATVDQNPQQNNILNAASVLKGMTAVFEPLNVVYIRLQSPAENGMVIGRSEMTSQLVFGEATKLSFSPAAANQTVLYDMSSGVFIPQ